MYRILLLKKSLYTINTVQKNLSYSTSFVSEISKCGAGGWRQGGRRKTGCVAGAWGGTPVSLGSRWSRSCGWARGRALAWTRGRTRRQRTRPGEDAGPGEPPPHLRIPSAACAVAVGAGWSGRTLPGKGLRAPRKATDVAGGAQAGTGTPGGARLWLGGAGAGTPGAPSPESSPCPPPHPGAPPRGGGWRGQAAFAKAIT